MKTEMKRNGKWKLVGDSKQMCEAKYMLSYSECVCIVKAIRTCKL